jgi:hypothetical protein
VHGRKELRRYLALVPRHGFAPRGRLALTQQAKRLTARNATALVQSEPGHSVLYCSLGL